MKKQMIAGALCGALLAGLLASPAAALFPDVSDPQLTEAVEVLRQLNVINGKPDGTFDPQGTFTRSEFCKMALTVLGREEEARIQSGRVIFSDVTANHWALGYVNAAAAVREGSTSLVQGRGDGTFGPDLPITCGEAVTILMRCLGYTDQDVGSDGGAWYSGYVLRARDIGLMEGLEDVAGAATLTRAQAAFLFKNLLFTETKGSTDVFLTAVLDGSVSRSELLLDIGTKALTAGGFAVTTDKGSYVTFRSNLNAALRGQRVTLALDKEDRVLSVSSDVDHSSRTVSLLTARAQGLTTQEGEQLAVDADTPVWRSDGVQKTYANAYQELAGGTNVVLSFDKTDELTSIYLPTDAAGSSVTDSQLVLEVKGKALSSGGWVVTTDKGTYVTFRADLPTDFQGKRCRLVLDSAGNVLDLRQDNDYTTRTLRILSAEARYAVTDQDAQLLVPGATPVWRVGSDQQSYSQAYKEIAHGATAVFCYDKTDTLTSIYLTGGSASLTAVAGEGSGPFDGAWEETPTAVYKNGVKSSLAQVKPYDVGTLDPYTGVLELSDRKLTGVYENASPSPVSPSTVTVMGAAFPVLDCALQDLTAFAPGDRVTLLLDQNNNVAGVVSPSKASASALGVATVTIGQPDTQGRETYDAQVVLTTGVTLKGKVHRISQQAMDLAPGKLYAVTSTRVGELELTTPSSDAIPGDWNVAANSMGATPVSPAVAVYDKAEGGPLVRLDWDALTLPTVPAGKITFLHLDNAGQADVVVLEDCTGDAYTYGRVTYQSGEHTTGIGASSPATTTVTNGGKGSLSLVTSSSFSSLAGSFMGLAPSLSTVDGQPRLGASVKLTAIQGVPRSAFGEKTVTAEGKSYPLAADIDNCCFNTISETWFDSLDAALAYASTLTVYYDKDPAQGGKIRLVAAE